MKVFHVHLRVLLQRQHFPLCYFKTRRVGLAEVELTTSRMAARGLTNWAISVRSIDEPVSTHSRQGRREAGKCRSKDHMIPFIYSHLFTSHTKMKFCIRSKVFQLFLPHCIRIAPWYGVHLYIRVRSSTKPRTSGFTAMLESFVFPKVRPDAC